MKNAIKIFCYLKSNYLSLRYFKLSLLHKNKNVFFFYWKQFFSVVYRNERVNNKLTLQQRIRHKHWQYSRTGGIIYCIYRETDRQTYTRETVWPSFQAAAPSLSAVLISNFIAGYFPLLFFAHNRFEFIAYHWLISIFSLNSKFFF